MSGGTIALDAVLMSILGCFEGSSAVKIQIDAASDTKRPLVEARALYGWSLSRAANSDDASTQTPADAVKAGKPMMINGSVSLPTR